MNTYFELVEYMSDEWQRAVRLREDILRKPQGSQFSKKELQEEKDHINVIGLLNNEVVATAVLVPEKRIIKMQRVVVKDILRNGNIGSNMMKYCEAVSLERGFVKIYCHARDGAVRFYKKNGYDTEGEYFNEDGIPHLKMIKSLI